jgi:hypothetical protein
MLTFLHISTSIEKFPFSIVYANVWCLYFTSLKLTVSKQSSKHVAIDSISNDQPKAERINSAVSEKVVCLAACLTRVKEEEPHWSGFGATKPVEHSKSEVS